MLPHDRLLDLLAAHATEGLSAGESNELEQSLAGQREMGLGDLDLAAAAVYLAYDAACGTAETMPESLKRKIFPPDIP